MTVGFLEMAPKHKQEGKKKINLIKIKNGGASRDDTQNGRKILKIIYLIRNLYL